VRVEYHGGRVLSETGGRVMFSERRARAKWSVTWRVFDF
jgi:hypothetical protein